MVREPGGSGEARATRRNTVPLNNMHQLFFIACVVCVAFLVYIASAVLGPSVPLPRKPDSLAARGPPALQLSVSGETIATQVSFFV